MRVDSQPFTRPDDNDALQGAVTRARELKDSIVAYGFASSDKKLEALCELETLSARFPSAEIIGYEKWSHGVYQVAHGSLSDAITCLNAAEAHFFAANLPSLAAQTQIPKIVALSNIGDLVAAESTAKRILQVFSKQNAPLDASKVELNLASLLLQQDRYAESERHYRAASARAAQAGDTLRSIKADCGLGAALAWQGEFSEARLIFQRVVARAKRVQADELIGIAFSGLARIEMASGNLAVALKHAENWLTTAESLGSSLRTFDAKRDLVDVYVEASLYPEALSSLYDLRATVVDKSLGSHLPWIDLQIARVLFRTARTEDAQLAYRLALTGYTEHQNPCGFALVQLGLAECAFRLSKIDDAKLNAELARTYFASNALDHLRDQCDLIKTDVMREEGAFDDAVDRLGEIVNSTQSRQDHAIEAHAQSRLGLVFLDMGQESKAIEAFERSAHLIESSLSILPSVAFRSAVRAELQAPYDGMICVALATRANVSRQIEHVLSLMERSRSVTSFEDRDVRETSRDEAQSEIYASIAATRARLNWLYAEIQRSLEEGKDIAKFSADARRFEEHLMEAMRRDEISREPASVALASRGVSLGDIRSKLNVDDLFVQFHCLAEEIVVCVVSHTTDFVFQIPSLAVQQTLARLRFQILAPQAGSIMAIPHHKQLVERADHWGRKLFSLLFTPMAEELSKADRVVIVPHGMLHLLPWSAVLSSTLNRVPKTVTTVGALNMPSPRRSPLQMGAGLIIGAGRNTLPHVASEIAAVTASVNRCITFEGDNATIESVQTHCQHVALLHFACHATFRHDSPSFSGLHLADGIFTVVDIAGLKLRAELVTLSACESAVHNVQPGESLTGLCDAFLKAGASAVLAASWTVNDKVTSELMREFYTRLGNGDAPESALADAQEIIRSEHPHPYFWAGFSVKCLSTF
jgi:CHAT domain-containing protein